MLSVFVSSALLISGASGEPQLAASPAPKKLSCMAGPIERRFGGVPWHVFGRDDQQSIVVVSTPQGLDGSFYFVVNSISGTTSVMGEGTGSVKVTDAANAELRKLSANDINGLIVEAEAKGTQP
jgi:hypothetical protein